MSAEVSFAYIVLSALLSGGLAAYARSRIPARGARSLMLLCTGAFLLATCEALSMLSRDPAWALFWWNLRFLFSAFIPVVWLTFGLGFSGRAPWRTRRLLLLASLVPVITQLVLWTNAGHNLWVRHEVGFVSEGAFTLAVTGERVLGPWFAVHAFYSLLLTLLGVALLLLPAWRQARQRLGQTLLLSAGALISITAATAQVFQFLPRTRWNLPMIGFGLAAALITIAVLRFGFLKRVPETLPLAGAAEEKRTLALFLLTAVLIVSGLGGLAFQAYARLKDQLRLDAQAQLAAIADLRVIDLEAWRAERLADAQVLSENPALAELIEAAVREPADAQATERLRAWMDSLHRAYGYETVLLLDTEGQGLLTEPADAAAMDPHLVQDAVQALAAGQPEMLDIHRDTDGSIHLDLVAPVSSPDTSRRPLGALVLRIDPAAYLYPHLQRWPVSSQTAEVIIVRREGDEIVFLSPLRSRPDAALTLRIPLERKDILAVRGMLGERGMIEALDCCGQQVVGEVRPIPGTPWSLVVQIDQNEVYAPLRARLWEIAGFFLASVVASGSGLWLFWRRQQARHLRSQMQAAQALRASEEKFRAAFENSPDAVAITRLRDGTIVAVNQAFTRITGYPAAEVIGRPTREIGLWEDPRDRDRLIEVVRRAGRVENFGAHFRARDGRRAYGLMSASPFVVDGEEYLLSSTRDITERKRMEVDLERLNRMYALLSQVNQAVVRATDRITLFRSVCRVAVDHGRFRMAWIGWVDEDGLCLRPVAWAGVEDGYLSALGSIPLVDLPEGRGPAGTAVREGKTNYSNDISTDPRMALWRDDALQRGYRALISVPIREDGRVIGALILYASEPGFFQTEEIRLVEEVAADVTYALERLETEAKRRAAEQELRASEARYRLIAENSSDVIWTLDNEFRFTYISPSIVRLRGLTPEEAMAERVEDTMPPESARQVNEMLAELVQHEASGEAFDESILFEIQQYHRDGSLRWIEIHIRVLRDSRGVRQGFLGISRDVTDRHRAEVQLQESQARFSTIFHTSPVAIALTQERDSLVVDVNEAWEELTGYSRADIVGRTTKDVNLWLEPQDRQELIQSLQAQGEARKDVTIRRSSGEIRDVSMLATIISLAGEDYLLTMAQDITERRRAEAAMRRHLEFLTALQDTTRALLSGADLEGLLKDIVHHAAGLVGATAGFLDLVHPGSTLTEPRVGWGALFEALHCPAAPGVGVAGVVWQTRAPLVVEDYDAWPHRHPGIPPGLIRAVVGVPMQRGEGEVLGVIGLGYEPGTDRSFGPEEMELLTQFAQLAALALERSELLEALRSERDQQAQRVWERTAELEAANRELEAFAYSVSHDLRGPLRALDGFSSALLREASERLDETGRHYLERIGAASRRMAEMIDALLGLSRVTRREMKREHVDLSALFAAAVAEIQAQDPRRRVEWVIPDGLSAYGDGHLLGILATNLLENAWKFTAPRAEARIEVGMLSLERAPGQTGPLQQAVYFVRDNGVGFDPAYADKLFAPFQRLHTQAEFPGTGIGLATVQRIVARHGGSIWAEAEIDGGATFYFALGGGP